MRDSIQVHQQIGNSQFELLIKMVHRYPTYIISKRPIKMLLCGLHHEFYLNILIFLQSHQNYSQNPFFVIDTSKCGQLSIITVAFSVGCFPCEIFTSSGETWCNWNCFTAILILMETCYKHCQPIEIPFF